MSDNIPAKGEFDQARAEAAVRELLISEALVIAAGEGCEWVSLSGAPLAGSAEKPSTLDTLLAKIGEE